MNTLTQVVPAHRTEQVTYAVRDVVVVAQQVAATGREMLYLNIGDPNLFDFKTPDHIVDATLRAMQDNRNGYAPSSGIPDAIEAIRAQADRSGIRNIRDIFVTTGASEAIDVCFSALVNAGENVLTPTPGYPLYTAVLAKLEAKEIPYYLDEDNDWQPDLEDIASKITPKTRAIVLINPNNPTGSVCERKTLEGILELARKHNLVIFADEIYDKLILDGGEHVSIASLDHEHPIITFNGMSKAYVAPGFRIGWGIVSGNPSVISNYVEAINKLLRARLSANHPEQYAIAAALDGDQSHLTEIKQKLSHRRDLSVSMLNAIPGVSCVAPRGAFYAFPRLTVDQSDELFVRELIKAKGVVTVHGSGFGQRPGTKHFRIVFLPQEEILRKAYAHIEEFLSVFEPAAA
ncbi:MAG: aminotransferase class I/II-fold pyridoxal phosphate-dependent enzyme [Calditrichaeota bacterium]|nr:aminotransferase class I/II-fold pyridoxal phosphate-dependent enzyme [Calditrichota bacterium]MCB9391146.1 aminotransferase class I/II-fold pyridoxal phosphate-dependent enzyme [Calditrichota bacterium]